MRLASSTRPTPDDPSGTRRSSAPTPTAPPTTPPTIAYIGELDYGGSAVSLPITNDAGILQVSPGDGLTSLTRTPPGRPRAGPERYYPSDVRSFVRLTPDDLLQAETLLARLRAAGSRRLAVLWDPDIYGRELGAELAARARRDGPEPVATEEYDGEVEDIPDLVRAVAEAQPDAIAYAGIAGPGTGPLLAAIDRAAARRARVRDRRHPRRATRRRPFPVGAGAGRGARRGGAGVAHAARRAGAYCARSRGATAPARARPEALYGYEAMRLVLDAIRERGRPTGAR